MLLAAVFWTAVGLMWPAQSHAREWLGLTGLELAEQGTAYAFAGAITPLNPDTALGQGWVQRYWFDWVHYRFDSEGEQVRSRAPGFSASLGYQQSDSQGYWAAYAGAGYRNTRLTPDRPTAKVRGSQSAFLFIGEMDRRPVKDWRFTGAMQLAAGPDSYWTRLKILRHVSNGAFWGGAEMVFQGDPDYRAIKAGFVLDEWGMGKGIAVNFKLGVAKTKGLETDAYSGIELVGHFDAK